jgi:hypothetical protein
MLIKLQVYFPSATVWAYNNTISFRDVHFWDIELPELLHWNWHTNSENKVLTIGRLQLTQHKQMIEFFHFWNLFSSLLLKLSTWFEIRPCLQDPSTAAISEWMLHLHTYFSSAALNSTDTNFSDPLSHWQRCHCRTPDLSHITDTNVVTTWLNRTQIIPAKLIPSEKILMCHHLVKFPPLQFIWKLQTIEVQRITNSPLSAPLIKAIPQKNS